MTHHSVPRAIACAVIVCTAIAAAADLQDETGRAYDGYAQRAAQLFLERVRSAASATDNGPFSRAATPRDGEVVARPAREDGITAVSGGLVHHWLASTFIAGVTLQHVLDVSYDYTEYHAVYTPVLVSKLLSHDGNTYRVMVRIKGSGGGLSAVVDITSRVQYFFPDTRSVYSIATSEEIREVRNAGTSNERRLAPGHDSGYLWRAATLNYLVERDHGVFVHTEALGLSRSFPPFLGWIIEPVARRLGRSSVERSLQEFSRAVRARAQA
jgi:hypothetical protein